MADKKLSPLQASMGRLADYPTNPLPEFSLDQTNLPAIKSWKVSGKYTLTVEVEMVSIGKDTYDKENELRARFKVLKVKEVTAKADPAKKGYE